MKLIYVQVLGFSFTVCISVQINVVMRNSSGKQYFMIYSSWLKHIRKFHSLFFLPPSLPPSFPASSPVLLGPLSIRVCPWLLYWGRCFISARAQMADEKEQSPSIRRKQSGGPEQVATELPYPPCLEEVVCSEKKTNPNIQSHFLKDSALTRRHYHRQKCSIDHSMKGEVFPWCQTQRQLSASCCTLNSL